MSLCYDYGLVNTGSFGSLSQSWPEISFDGVATGVGGVVPNVEVGMEGPTLVFYHIRWHLKKVVLLTKSYKNQE